MSRRFGTSPADAEAGFYAAFEQLDLHLMSALWLDGDRAVCIHPGGGLVRGKESVMRSWKEIFSGSQPPQIEHRLIDSFHSEDLAVRLVEERIRPRGDASRKSSRVIATNVYVRVRGSWFLAEHHGSLPLVESVAPTTREEPRIH